MYLLIGKYNARADEAENATEPIAIFDTDQALGTSPPDPLVGDGGAIDGTGTRCRLLV